MIEDKVKESKISFDEYRIKATNEDIKKLDAKIKPFWWENIPVIGCLAYLIRTTINQQDIDRGLLRKQILKYNLIFLFSTLFVGYGLLRILTPWFLYFIYKIAIKKTKELVEKNDI